MNKQEFQDNLLRWYATSKRILPWRTNPSPYRVWISEIMLQQTRVETVIPYFERFVSTLPTIKDVAEADEDLLNKLWEGLGYYSRVRNIQKASIIIQDQFDGVFPSNYKDIISLPGIGPYTAGAISSIAFNKSYTAVDGNVLRVFARLYGIKDNIKDPKTKETIKHYVDTLLPDNHISEFNQGLMEIGATVCLPKGQPKCSLCPLQDICIAKKKDLTNEIPYIVRTIKKKTEQKTVVILVHNNTFAIEKRPSNGLLANLYQFPLFDGHLGLNDLEELFKVEESTIRILEQAKHIFSHKIWEMNAFLIPVDTKNQEYIWASLEDIKNQYSIPSAFATYKKFIEVTYE